MTLDLKPLTKEVIQKMGWAPHDLWLVKLNDEIYGPFEVESLKDYASENEAVFEKAMASRMDVSDWHPFYSHAHFSTIAHSTTEEKKEDQVKYWILLLGHKAGPLTFMDISKKLELEIISLSDLVSTDEGHTWKKFYQLEAFNQHQGSDELPMAPLESSFQRARDELDDWMDTHDRTDSKINLAAMAFLGHSQNKTMLNLDEIDLKSLEQTEVSRSLKWAAPTAVAVMVCFVVLGNFLLSPSTDTDLADASDKPEVIMPKRTTHKASRSRPNNAHVPERAPSSYQPMPRHERSGLTNAPVIHSEPYRREEPQYNEPDPMIDPISEAEQNPPAEPQEHSLVNNQLPHDQGQPGESLDQAMNGGEQPLEAPVIEEAADF